MRLAGGEPRMTYASRYVLMSALFSAALLTSAVSQAAESPASRIAEIERGLDLAQLMRQHEIPGISVAVIDHFKLDWASCYGVTEKNDSITVTPRTLFPP